MVQRCSGTLRSDFLGPSVWVSHTLREGLVNDLFHSSLVWHVGYKHSRECKPWALWVGTNDPLLIVDSPQKSTAFPISRRNFFFRTSTAHSVLGACGHECEWQCLEAEFKFSDHDT